MCLDIVPIIGFQNLKTILPIAHFVMKSQLKRPHQAKFKLIKKHSVASFGDFFAEIASSIIW